MTWKVKLNELFNGLVVEPVFVFFLANGIKKYWNAFDVGKSPIVAFKFYPRKLLNFSLGAWRTN